MFRKLATTGRRALNLQEFASKQLMEKHGLSVQRFRMAENEAEAVEGGKYLLESGAPELVIKAQILAGGRGKGTFDTGFKVRSFIQALFVKTRLGRSPLRH